MRFFAYLYCFPMFVLSFMGMIRAPKFLAASELGTYAFLMAFAIGWTVILKELAPNGRGR
jgi:hypothetical protein